MTSLLFLDHWYSSWPERVWTRCKIILKEAIWHGHWDLVFRVGKAFGSVVINQDLKSALKAQGVQLLTQIQQSNRATPTVVFKDVRNLRAALRLKHEGQLGKLLAGPFVATMPFEYNQILLDPGIDGLVFLSAWHRDMFLREASHRPRACHLWFAGVDTDFWTPAPERQRDKVLVYFKQGLPSERQAIEQALRDRGIPFEVVVYGQYEKDQYKALLQDTSFVIFIHQTETQGLATFEAWSMDCPTLHLNPGSMHFLGKVYPGASSCPYLSASTGLDFPSVQVLGPKLDEMLARWRDFTPRHEVLARYTLAHSAQRFLQILEAT